MIDKEKYLTIKDYTKEDLYEIHEYFLETVDTDFIKSLSKNNEPLIDSLIETYRDMTQLILLTSKDDKTSNRAMINLETLYPKELERVSIALGREAEERSFLNDFISWNPINCNWEYVLDEFIDESDNYFNIQIHRLFDMNGAKGIKGIAAWIEHLSHKSWFDECLFLSFLREERLIA